jgi:hypothetical protein
LDLDFVRVLIPLASIAAAIFLFVVLARRRR